MKLSIREAEVHGRAMEYATDRSTAESNVVGVLREVESLKIYRKLGVGSLYEYAVAILSLDRAFAYSAINVARKSAAIPELKIAIAEQTISVYVASRIVSALTKENAKELIRFAKEHTTREIDLEVGRRNPKAAKPDKVKIISADQVQITTTISLKTLRNLERKQSLEAQKGNNQLTLGNAIDLCAETDLEKNDPVRKAERSIKRAGRRRPTNELCAPRVQDRNRSENEYLPNRGLTIGDLASPARPFVRTPLTAAQRHAVFHKFQGKCTHRDSSGKVCGSERWVDIHHIFPVSLGGTNDLENLTLLCSSHHDLVHQLSLPIEGQVTWLRSPQVTYG